jgi:HK97 family phage major capsid protein
MASTTATLSALVAPATVEELFLRPLLAQALATNAAVSTVRLIGTHDLKIPRVTGDPTVAHLDELEAAPLSDMGADAITATPVRAAGVSMLSREIVEDSSPEAQAEVGTRLVEAYRKQLDADFLGNGTANAGKQPDGLGSLTAGAGEHQVQRLAIMASPTNLFWMEDAIAAAQSVGAEPTALLMNPTDLAYYGKLPTVTGGPVPLLQSDPSKPRSKMISGVPVIPARDCPAGTHYLVDGTRLRTVIRREAEISVSEHYAFREDGVAVKVSGRHTFAFPHPRSIVRLERAAS